MVGDGFSMEYRLKKDKQGLYLEDENKNKAYIDYFGEDVGIARSSLMSLVNCRKCINCIECKDCINCENCNNCNGLRGRKDMASSSI